MPRYIVLRALGDATIPEIEQAAADAGALRMEQFSEIDWLHSHVVKTPQGHLSYCVYTAPNERILRELAIADGMPADDVQEIALELTPEHA